MKAALKSVVVALALLSGCARPSSIEPFIPREKSEYGDTYSFNLDLADSTVSYSLGLYTRIERSPFQEYPMDSLNLGIRWISPSDSSFLDNVILRLVDPIDSAYASKDYMFSYKDTIDVAEHGEWRVRIQVRNNPESVRGLGIIFTRK
ncbi:MAG: hypothetical protein MJY86_00125 [Bacteroidales bacterium]|nr:hypothetical protein [Bacteroidales bacterium]